MFYFVIIIIIIIIIRIISCTDFTILCGFSVFIYIKPGLMFIQFYVSFFCFPWVGYQVLRPLTLRSFEGHLFHYFGRLSRFTIEGYSEKPILLRRVAIHARSYIEDKVFCSILHKG